MYCTILCNSVQCTILLYSSSCSSNLKIIQHDPSPSPGNATCNQERGCSHHCGDWSTASVLNQRSTAPESWRLEKCPGNSLKKLEKTAVFRRAGIPICQIARPMPTKSLPTSSISCLWPQESSSQWPRIIPHPDKHHRIHNHPRAICGHVIGTQGNWRPAKLGPTLL